MLASLRPKAMRVLTCREEPTFCFMTSKISAVESHSADRAASYKHLTLPPKRGVEKLGGGGGFKKKKNKDKEGRSVDEMIVTRP